MMKRITRLSWKIDRLEERWYRMQSRIAWQKEQRERAIRKENGNKTVTLTDEHGVEQQVYVIDILEQTHPELFVTGLRAQDMRAVGGSNAF